MLIKHTFFIDDKFDFVCDEYANAVIASWYGKGYDMMFAEAMNVECGDGRDWLLKERIKDNKWNMYNCVKKYHGMAVSDELKASGIDLIGVISEEISKGNPIMISVNMKRISCIEYIDKKDNPYNVAIVVGISGETEEVFFKVIHGRDKYINVLSMSFGELRKSVKSIRKFADIGSEISQFDLNVYFEDVTRNIIRSGIHEKIEEFADYFEKDVEYNQIFKKAKEKKLRDVPLVNNVAVLYRSRALFSFCLTYLAQVYHSLKLQNLADEMMVSAGKFYNIRGYILKCFYSKEISDKYKDKISAYLHKIVKIEKSVIDSMKNFSKEDFNNDSLGLKEIPEGEHVISYVDIAPFFNNQAFESKITHQTTANFDGMGGYFIDSNYPYGQLLKVGGGLKFQIAKRENEFDNISCLEQRISVKEGRYHYIMILASSCHGSFKDYFKLVYENEEEESVLVFSSSFWYPKAHFSEVTAWSGDYAMLINGEFYLEQRKLNIYANRYSIDCNKILKAIVLPDCPDMHVFAISLA